MSINSRSLLLSFRSLLLAKDMFFGKQKFDVKQLKMNKFTFNIKTVEDEQIYKIYFEMDY